MTAQELTDATYDKLICGCGRPEEALTFLRDALRLIGEKRPDGGRAEWDEWYKGHKAREDALFGGADGLKYLLWYSFDHHGLTEHGGSVPGWLTGKGEDLLAALDKYGCDPDAWREAIDAEVIAKVKNGP